MRTAIGDDRKAFQNEEITNPSLTEISLLLFEYSTSPICARTSIELATTSLVVFSPIS